MHRAFTEIIETRKLLWWNIEESDRGVQLHLLVTALHGISATLGRILKGLCIV
jgi:hypothetical protein